MEVKAKMYKDKDRQREANKQAKKRWNAKRADAEALGIPEEGIPPLERIPKRQIETVPPPVTPTLDKPLTGNTTKRGKAIKMTDYEREHYKPASQLRPGQYNPVSKPGGADYNGVCTEEWRAQRGC